MLNRQIPLFIFAFSLIQSVESSVVLNLTNTEKLLCYSCKGSHCETITNEEDNIILCNKFTQLCWAGFVDQQPYRTCASRYCTPSGISLDSDVRIETCCHSNLCNTVSLSWSLMSKWFRKSSLSHSSTARSMLPVVTTEPTTSQLLEKNPAEPQVFIVNEIVDGGKKPSDSDVEQEQSRALKSRLNVSDPASFGINWERVPYDKDFSVRVASISKLLILLMPILLVFLF